MRYLHRLPAVAMIILTITAVSACAKTTLETADISVNGIKLSVELAVDDKSRERGLMFRKELAEGSGMLFVYPAPQQCRLWMKDTIMPLSAAFIDNDGIILQIIKMEKVRSLKIYRSNDKAKYALEVPLGWFDKNHVKTGDRFDIPEIYSK